MTFSALSHWASNYVKRSMIGLDLRYSSFGMNRLNAQPHSAMPAILLLNQSPYGLKFGCQTYVKFMLGLKLDNAGSAMETTSPFIQRHKEH